MHFYLYRSGLFRHNSRDKPVRTSSALQISRQGISIITEDTSPVLQQTSIQNSQVALTQPTPPPSPARNRISSETEPKKLSPTHRSQTPPVSPSTSPKHGGVQTTCPSSPSRNYRYYTSSSAEMTPPGSPSKSRTNQSSGSTSISNKASTVVWHQATPPSSPKHSNRKAKSPSPKSIHSDKSGYSSASSRESAGESPLLKSKRGVKSSLRSSKKSINESSSIEEDKNFRRSSGTSKRALSSKRSEEKKSSKSNVVVKITSPTTPPKNDESDLLNNSHSKFLLQGGLSSLPPQGTESIPTDAPNKSQKLIERHRQKMKSFHRQFSLPEDSNNCLNGGQPTLLALQPERRLPLQRSSTLEEEMPTNHRFAKIDGTVSDGSFNSATLSYATLFYSPRQESSKPPARKTNFAAPSHSISSIHVVRVPNVNSSQHSIRHSIIRSERNGNQRSRASNSSILRERFGSHTSKSLDLDSNGVKIFQEIPENSQYKSKFGDKNKNVEGTASLKNTPSLSSLEKPVQVGKHDSGNSRTNFALRSTIPPNVPKRRHFSNTNQLSKNEFSEDTNHLESSRSKHKDSLPISKERNLPTKRDGRNLNSSLNREISVLRKNSNSNLQNRPKGSDEPPQNSFNAQDTNSPPSSRLCRISAPVLSSKSSSSNVPSWMKQTISRILATTGPPYSKKQMSRQGQT